MEEKTTFKLNELYDIYRAFYQDTNCLDKVEEDFLTALRNSVSLINSKVLDPIYVPFNATKNSDTAKIAKTSLRGDSRFVQMAICNIEADKTISFADDYAYDVLDAKDDTTITESISKIQGYDDSSKNLVAFMHAKHHNIVEGYKKAYKDFELLNQARTSETPIYLSYTPTDLKKVNSSANPHSIYYVLTDRQPVGSMAIDKLTHLT